MKDARWREPGLDEFQHPLPRHGGLLATPRQRAFPQYRDVVAESHECPGVRGHCVVGEESRRDLPQPVPLFGDWVVHPPPQFVLHSPKCRSHAVASGLPENLELSLACMPANERETQKGKSLRFAKTALLALCRRMAAKLDQSRLIRVQRQRNTPATAYAILPETAWPQLRTQSPAQHHPRSGR